MDYTVLQNEIQQDPTGAGYSAKLPFAPGHVVDMLNAVTTTKLKPRYVTARTILAECGAEGGNILDALEAASAMAAVKWAVRFLGTNEGIDVGSPATQYMVDQLVLATVLTPEYGEALKNLAIQPASRAEVLGLGFVTEQDLRNAGVI